MPPDEDDEDEEEDEDDDDEDDDEVPLDEEQPYTPRASAATTALRASKDRRIIGACYQRAARAVYGARRRNDGHLGGGRCTT
jgi:hypothetical protein